MKIIALDMQDPRIKKIEQGLNAFNTESGVSISEPQSFALISEDDGGRFLGGAKVRIFAGWLELSWLYVAEKRQGTGSRLMEVIEKQARQSMCAGIFLNTFSFQAPEFYKKHGFVVFGEIPAFIEGHSRLYMMKRFNMS
jgi:GNAT superfamily N-acetyltransferase